MRALPGALLALVIVFGAVLRFDALTLTYGPVERPGWLRSVQQSRAPESVLRPAGVTWTPVEGRRYISDPYTYLQYAREMRSFYDAHHREPLFPFVTRVALAVLSQQDVAVSFASALFSVLAILGTYLLGAFAFSRAAGLIAAAAMAIEYDLITLGIAGWRDDAFTCAVVFSAYAMARCARAPSRGNAIFLGLVAGLACLVRITSLSFLLPGLFFLLVRRGQPWRERLTRVSLAAALMTVIVAPFLINCWRAYGDPFYAINVHADIYRATEGQSVATSQTAAGYIRATAASHPMRTLDTFVLGLTSYPFMNKWQGFDRWIPGLGAALAIAAIAGLLLWVGSSAGRLYLLLLATSLVPFAVTWRLIADWRFTEHAYPFFLIAAGLAITRVAGFVVSVARGTTPARVPAREVFVFWGSVAGMIGVVAWLVVRVLPLMTVGESLRASEEVTIFAGGRDGSFFADGWSRPVRGVNVTTRASRGPRSVLRIPIPGPRDYSVTIRADPDPPPADPARTDLPKVQVLANGELVAVLNLGWRPDRIGAYDIQIPRRLMRTGTNRLTFVSPAAGPGTPAGRFRLWYVRVRPLTELPPASPPAR